MFFIMAAACLSNLTHARNFKDKLLMLICCKERGENSSISLKGIRNNNLLRLRTEQRRRRFGGGGKGRETRGVDVVQ